VRVRKMISSRCIQFDATGTERQFIKRQTSNIVCNVFGAWLLLGGGNTFAQNTFPASGNVGIGTTNPVSNLQVESNQDGLANVQGVAFTAIDAGINNSITFNTKGSLGTESDRALIDATGNGASVLYARGDGNVGIGTTVPHSSLEVNGNITLTPGVNGPSGANITFSDGSVQSTAWNGTTLGGDYAESIDVLGDRAGYEPGDVIVIDPNRPGKFAKSDRAYSKLVAGVFSTKPGLVGRRLTFERTDKAAEVPMAMVGIVPTKVTAENGPIEPGDLLVSSSKPGYAMKGSDGSRLTGAVLGKALAPLSSGDGVIEVMISIQ
jgi:hypothetical protein